MQISLLSGGLSSSVQSPGVPCNIAQWGNLLGPCSTGDHHDNLSGTFGSFNFFRLGAVPGGAQDYFWLSSGITFAWCSRTVCGTRPNPCHLLQSKQPASCTISLIWPQLLITHRETNFISSYVGLVNKIISFKQSVYSTCKVGWQSFPSFQIM